MPRASRLLLSCAAVGALLALAPAARAQEALKFGPCGEGTAPNVTCADFKVPRDYGNPDAGAFVLHIAKSPATDPQHRIGSLFMNFGGPGAPMAIFFEAFGADLFPELNKRFDMIGIDPRGTGETRPSVDCKVNQEKLGIYSQPFPTPFTVDGNALAAKDNAYIKSCLENNQGFLQYMSTANVARDFDAVRAALGEPKLNYFGFSYGTFLGATYATLFPKNYRAMVLDGPIDASRYLSDPLDNLAEQTGGFEKAFRRFIQACAAHQDACHGFGGDDPLGTFDDLADRLDRTPIPAAGYAPDPRPVDGDDVRAVAYQEMFSAAAWGELANALTEAAAGDGSEVRRIVDESFYGRDPETGAFSPLLDRYFTITAGEQVYPAADVGRYLRAGAHSWSENEHFWLNNGYVELNYGLWTTHAKDAYRGPFTVPANSPTPLVVANRYDPATPYRGARRLVADLGNARLLTMRGDGHTSYRTGSPDCIDTGIENYLNTLQLPPDGTVCKQQPPFAAAKGPRPLAVPDLLRTLG
jgi:pimeloyl-ACP methyl ester carboxylesterase